MSNNSAVRGSFKIGKRYNFSTLAPSVLGSEYKDMLVSGIIDHTMAIKYRDIMSLHRTLKPLITALPTNPNDCSYVLFKKSDSDDDHTLLLAIEYIDMYSIQEIVTNKLIVEIEDISEFDTTVIRNRLLELGYTKIKIRTE